VTPTTERLQQISAPVRASWQRFLEAYEPLRPELYRYCRHLTGNAWDAEDLTQDAMMRAFVALGTFFGELPEPRAWLFRVASNSWIDRTRRQRRARRLEADPEEAQTPRTPEPQAYREAASTLLASLSPQESIAVILKDVFDFSLEDAAFVLGTTSGAVKAALHRGRNRLAEPELRAEHAPAPGVLDAFVAAFNARDLERMTALLLDTASVEIVGLVTEYGPDAPQDPYTGSFAVAFAPLTNDERGGVAPALLEGYLGEGARAELRPFRDGWVALFWYGHVDGPAVRSLLTFETEGARIARVRNYFFAPDVLADVCTELGVPFRVNGYRYWNNE